jgi:hypothetical protein
MFTDLKSEIIVPPWKIWLETRWTANEWAPPDEDDPESEGFIYLVPPPGDGWIEFDTSSAEKTGWLRFREGFYDGGGA